MLLSFQLRGDAKWGDVSLKAPLRGIFHSSPVLLTGGRVKHGYCCAWHVYPSGVILLPVTTWAEDEVLFYFMYIPCFPCRIQDACTPPNQIREFRFLLRMVGN